MAAAPEAGQVTFQRLRLAQTLETAPIDVLQQGIDALEQLFVCLLPK